MRARQATNAPNMPLRVHPVQPLVVWHHRFVMETTGQHRMVALLHRGRVTAFFYADQWRFATRDGFLTGQVDPARKSSPLWDAYLRAEMDVNRLDRNEVHHYVCPRKLKHASG